MANDWFDEVVDGEPLIAEYWQVDYIDNLLPRTSITLEDQELISNRIFQKSFTQLEAEQIIIYLKENEVYSDPRDQYKKMCKSGMFNDKEI